MKRVGLSSPWIIVKNLLDYWKSSKSLTGVTCFQYAEYWFQITPFVFLHIKLNIGVIWNQYSAYWKQVTPVKFLLDFQ